MSSDQAVFDRDQFYRRSSHRLPDYDYTSAGYYYITVCVENHECVLGEVIENDVHLSEIGELVQSLWLSLPSRFPGTLLDDFVIMPNHLHGIIILPEKYPPQARRNRKRWRRPSLGSMVRAFKAAASRLIHTELEEEAFEWQEDYYDHIVRDETDLERIRLYIANNPARWSEDRFYRSQEALRKTHKFIAKQG